MFFGNFILDLILLRCLFISAFFHSLDGDAFSLKKGLKKWIYSSFITSYKRVLESYILLHVRGLENVETVTSSGADEPRYLSTTERCSGRSAKRLQQLFSLNPTCACQ